MRFITRVVFVFAFRCCLSFGMVSPPPVQNSSTVCVSSIFPPIWVTSYQERTGFGCVMRFDSYVERFPEYTSNFCTNSTPWDGIETNTVYLQILCGTHYSNVEFANGVQEGFFGNYSKIETLFVRYCKLRTISNKTFAGMTRLAVLWFDYNIAETVSLGIFDHLPNVKWIQFDNVNRTPLDGSFDFCRNQKLEYVTVRKNSITRIKTGQTKNSTCTELRLNSFVLEGNPIRMESKMFELYGINGVLNLARCSISTIESSFFFGLATLLDLDLEANNIAEFPVNVFSSLTSLIRLRLNDNKLSYIDVESFLNLPLESLRLENNFISYINGSLSESVPSLKELSLANNSLTRIMKRQFGLMAYMKTLNLSFNRIEYIENGTFSQYMKLERLDLACNRLTLIDALHLDSLRDFSIDSNFLSELEKDVFRNLPSLQNLKINKNNLSGYGAFTLQTCDLRHFGVSCNNYTSIYVTTSCKHSFTKPHTSFSFNASHNDLSRVLINIPNINQSLILNGNKISSFHGVFPLIRLQELHLRNNRLSEIPCDLPVSSENMTILDLGGNAIGRFCKQGLQSIKQLHSLYLDNNKLVQFDPVDVSTLHLSDNPLSCSCRNEHLKKWLLSKSTPVTDNITCVTDSLAREIILLGVPDNCEDELPVKIIILSVCIPVFFVLILILLSLRYRYEIKVIVFYKFNIRLGSICWKRAKSIVNEYTYDAFICFAEEDIQYVRNVLMPLLEPKYRLCIYHRDFPVGEDIAEAILNVIENSALTIVVLSGHFMQSRWGKYEFKQAHHNSMRHEHQKLLIIVIDKSVLEQKLDLTLKSNLFAKAYLTSDDILFREKLLHAMPKKRRNTGNMNGNDGDMTALVGEDCYDIQST